MKFKTLDKLDNYFTRKPFRSTLLFWLFTIILAWLGSALIESDIKWLWNKTIELTPISIILISFIPYLLFYILKFFSQGRSKTILNPSEYFILKKQEKDDHIYKKLLDFSEKSYTVTIRPSRETKYFRFGIKFGKTKSILDSRLSTGNPLFHISLEKDDSTLYCVYYNDKNQLWNSGNRRLINKYAHQEITIQIISDTIRTSLVISVNGQGVFHHDLEDCYLFGKLMAWGDSSDYRIDVGVKSYDIN